MPCRTHATTSGWLRFDDFRFDDESCDAELFNRARERKERFVGRLRELGRRAKQEVAFYRLVLADPRTPRQSRWLLGLAVAYLLMPFDLIPDFIPVLGQLDDVLIVPGLIILAMRKVPREVIEDCRHQVEG